MQTTSRKATENRDGEQARKPGEVHVVRGRAMQAQVPRWSSSHCPLLLQSTRSFVWEYQWRAPHHPCPAFPLSSPLGRPGVLVGQKPASWTPGERLRPFYTQETLHWAPVIQLPRDSWSVPGVGGTTSVPQKEAIGQVSWGIGSPQAWTTGGLHVIWQEPGHQGQFRATQQCTDGPRET